MHIWANYSFHSLSMKTAKNPKVAWQAENMAAPARLMPASALSRATITPRQPAMPLETEKGDLHSTGRVTTNR